MSDSQEPIREQLIEVRRAQILDAAARIFFESGFHHTTTKRIAREAGASEGTIYNYFDSRPDLLVGLMARLSALEKLDAELVGGPHAKLRNFLTGTFRQRTGRMEEGQAIMQAVLPDILANPESKQCFGRLYIRQIGAVLDRYVQAMVELGRIQTVDVPLVVRNIQAMFVGLLVLRIVGDETREAQWDRLPETIATLLLDGLGPREAT
jgi:AcrR family transcriptional regulator